VVLAETPEVEAAAPADARRDGGLPEPGSSDVLEELQRVLAAAGPRLRACSSRARAGGPLPLALRITIGRQGKVVEVVAVGPSDPRVFDCLKSIVTRLGLDPASDGPITVMYPFTLGDGVGAP
jgi:hypothetical protein